ncbi:MAG TPA: hypothetical protein VJ777_13220, partial [Mycobacterium sp.]|nr:hypothetical protein [Mycobacterium sp.]
MSKHARKSSPAQLRMLTAAMATGTVVAASAALIGDQAEPAAPGSVAPALAGLQVPTPNSLLMASTGTTALTGYSGATSSGGGPLATLSGLVPTAPSGLVPTAPSGRQSTSSSGPAPIALVGLAPPSVPTSWSASAPIALTGREPAGVPSLPSALIGPAGVLIPSAMAPAQSLPLVATIDLVVARLVSAPLQILANPLNVIGPGGWLIGDAVTAGANGGILIGDGADGAAPGQNGGNAGLLGGNGGDGADGGPGQDGGNG